MITEADTCRKYVLPKLTSAGWDTDPHSFTEQKSFTDGRIIVSGTKTTRRQQKRADYLLRYTRDFLIGVVEAKSAYKSATDGLQQAKDYAAILGLKFAYSTNGQSIVEFDFLTGKETELAQFPTPDALWTRLSSSQAITEENSTKLFAPYNHQIGKSPRYYQEIAINKTVQAILQGKKRVTPHHGHWHRQDVCRLSNLLEALEQPMESHGGISAPEESSSLLTARGAGR